jgi:hypothetical protein
MMWITGKKSYGGTFSFSNCHIKWLDYGSLVLIVFGQSVLKQALAKIVKQICIHEVVLTQQLKNKTLM